MSTVPASRFSTRAVSSGLDVAVSPAGVLAAALLVVALLAAFSHGAVSLAAGAWLQAAAAALAAITGAVALWSGRLRLTAPRTAVAGWALLAGFAVWSAVSLAWSVSPDATWIEFNRDLTYVVVLGLALVVGASERRASEIVAIGFLLISLPVAAYAIGQKLLPGLHVSGLLDLNQTGAFPRLQEPLGYWNALALFLALAVPAALALAADGSRRCRIRFGALVALQCLLLTIGLSLSRGGLIALVLGLIVTVLAGGSRLRTLMWLALACAGTAPPLVFALTDHRLTAAGVPLGSREAAGGVLLAVLVGSSAAVLAAGYLIHRSEPLTTLDSATATRIGRVLALAPLALLIAAVIALSLSGRGLGGSLTHAWHSFTATRATSNYAPDRLLSADSENRWVWWKEAAGAFSDRPAGGWGAGSFPVVHLLYRRDNLTVNQPHSVPLQFLAETGLIGALLALSGIALLLVGAAGAIRRLLCPQRALAAALLGGAAAYAVHATYDWDWDIPALTIPALMFVGVLAGGARGAATPSGFQALSTDPAGGRGATLTLTALLAIVTCAVGLSGALPSIAASQANDAIVTASGSSRASLTDAAAAAALSTRIDPLSDAGLRVEATIANRLGDPRLAVSYLLAAIRREPSDRQAWQQLLFLELFLGDTRDALAAAQRVLALDPRAPNVLAFFQKLVQQVTLERTPPRMSPTARPSPAAANRVAVAQGQPG